MTRRARFVLACRSGCGEERSAPPGWKGSAASGGTWLDKSGRTGDGKLLPCRPESLTASP
jgi:hypothetical protein